MKVNGTLMMDCRGLFDGSESKVLNVAEERKLLVELVDCKNRILEGLPCRDDSRSCATSPTRQRVSSN